jgi:hypothetical protein
MFMARSIIVQCDTKVAGVIGAHGARSKAEMVLRHVRDMVGPDLSAGRARVTMTP